MQLNSHSSSLSLVEYLKANNDYWVVSTKTRLIIVTSAILIVAVLVIIGAVTKAQTSQTNTQVILNLENGQQYFGVPRVYQGDNAGTPDSSWPLYYGPSTANSYWSQGGISSDQPVLDLVPYSGWASGAMFWSETYIGGSVTITMVSTFSEETANPADGFVIYLFLKPTMWGVSPQYNYSIPYTSTAGEYWTLTKYPSPVEGDVIYPQSSTPYIVVQWDPVWQTSYTLNGATGQWNVWIVSNPNGNNPSINPSSSPNLGSSFAGWDGIGTGAFQPRPGDWIKITVTYDPSTNTLTGVATDLNTGQLASFTLNLGHYYTPPSSGNYVFGVGAGTGWDYADWALLYVATTQQPTTLPPQSLSSLTVQVFNVLGRPATTVPGVVLGVLYNSGFKEIAFMNSSGYLNFYNIAPGTYTLEVYHYPNTGLNFTEYWGGMTVNLQSGSNFITFIRHEPWIYNLQVSASNGSIVVTVTVNGTVTSPTQGEIELWVTNNPSLASPYSPSKVFYFTINPGLNTFNLTYPASQAGTYYVYAAVLTYISTYTVTDQWNWTATITAATTTTVGIGNSQSNTIPVTTTNTVTTTSTVTSTVTSLVTTTVTSPVTTTVISTVTSPTTTTVTSTTTFTVTTTSPVTVTTTVFTTSSIIQTMIIALIIIIVVLAAALVAVMIRRR